MGLSLRRLRISSRAFACLATGALVFLAACSGSDAGSLDRSASGERDDGSRGAADGSRSSAGSRTESPSSSAATGPFFRAAADRGTFADFELEDAVVGDDGAIRIAEGKGRAGKGPRSAGYERFYTGGEHRFAVATSPVWTPKSPFDSVTPSFEASTPPGTWIEIMVSARVDGRWTKDYSLGVWAEDDGTVRRHSIDGQGDGDGDVATDTLELHRPADALRVKAILYASAGSRSTPTLRAVAAVATNSDAAPIETAGDPAARGKILPVPQRSQLLYEGGSAWCSPTSTSMILAYWADVLGAAGLRETVPEAAKRCHDHVYRGTGNWPFNTAHAAAMDGGRLHGAVTRLSSFGQVERLVAADIPVAISVRYGPSELAGSPMSSTDGHILVVRGFTESGDVVCNDPAFGSDATVRVTYDREQLTRAWQRSLGTTYLIWPAGKRLPVDPSGAFF